MFYQRSIYPVIKKSVNKKEIVVLTGMRRVGKTTLYRMIYDELPSENKVFLDMENPISQRIFEERDYQNIMHNLRDFGIDPEGKAYIFLDEIQAMPSLVRAVKYLYDHFHIKFFLTGSSSYYLKNLFPESLAGRKFIFELFPLDFQEFLVFQNEEKGIHRNWKEREQKKSVFGFERFQKYFDAYLRFGGFPEVALAKGNNEKKMKLNDIFTSYFEKDVKMLSDFRDISSLRDTMFLLMQRVGSKIDVSKIAGEIGVARETIYSYLSFLESTYFVSFLRPFTRSVDREVSGARKVYLCDTGFLNEFAKVSEGSLFENAVFLNLRKHGKLQYYQKRTGAEIDFILNGKIAFEVKTTAVRQDTTRLEKITKPLGLRERYVISRNFVGEKNIIPCIEL